jgi:hypothetical protein
MQGRGWAAWGGDRGGGGGGGVSVTHKGTERAGCSGGFLATSGGRTGAQRHSDHVDVGRYHRQPLVQPRKRRGRLWIRGHICANSPAAPR